MIFRRSATPAALLAILLGLTAPAAHADDRATAQELFQQGKDLLAAGKAAEACTKFAAAADLVQTAGVRLNLASCYEKIGRTASAWTRYDEALTIAERAGDSAAATFASSAKSALTPRLSYITVAVPPSSVLAGLEVTRDGEKLPQAAWGVPVPVDPGDHMLGATAPGHEPWTIKTSVQAQSAKIEIAVPVLAVSATPPPQSAQPAPGAAPAPDATPARSGGLFSGPGATQREIALVAGGLGVVGIGIGSVFGAEMLSKKQTNIGGGFCSTPGCGTQSQSAVSAGNLATVGWIAGGVLIAGGAVIWLTAPSAKATTTAALVPLGGPGGAGVGVEGIW